MNRQEHYRKRYGEKVPGWENSEVLYRDTIDRLVSSSTRILDIGCGHGELLKGVYQKTAETYGLDPDEAALEKNTIITHKAVGTAENIPFEDNFFDVVVSAWVLEHLEDPVRVFTEIHRVLKPGGKVVFLTPNAWNYNTWIIRLIPNRFHEFFTRRLYGRHSNDTFPVKYRINSPRRIRKTLTPIGFERDAMILNGDPSYISFNDALFTLACMLEKLHDVRYFRKARVHIIGVYRKMDK